MTTGLGGIFNGDDMPQKLPNINCQCYRNGNCMHQAAPRRWFGQQPCILIAKPADTRIKRGCALQYEYTRPDGHPLPPPARVIREGVGGERYMPPNETN